MELGASPYPPRLLDSGGYIFCVWGICRGLFWCVGDLVGFILGVFRALCGFWGRRTPLRENLEAFDVIWGVSLRCFFIISERIVVVVLLGVSFGRVFLSNVEILF